MCYDDGCHLKKYAINPIRVNQTPTASLIASLNIVVDKLHFRGHVGDWCSQHCNPHKFPELEKVYYVDEVTPALHKLSPVQLAHPLSVQVDTEICEQIFSWMSRYARITQHMNRTHFLFYLLYLSDAHNQHINRSH